VGGCTQRVQTAWPSLDSALVLLWVGHCCPPMQNEVEKTVLFMVTISDGEAFFPVWVSGCGLSAMTITRSLMGGCGLSHECKTLGTENSTELGIW